MWWNVIFLLLVGSVSIEGEAISSAPITFRNVEIKLYSMYTYKGNQTITGPAITKDLLPKTIVFDEIQIIDTHIPVLYKKSISDFDDLDELILTNDGIEDIQPGAFYNVPQLRKLVLKNNKIKTIREGIFNHLALGTLDLSLNEINNISPGAFDNMVELLNINLADNKLGYWDSNWLHNTPILTRISFQNNVLEKIPDNAFKNMAGVKHFGQLSLPINLIFTGNKIKTISKTAFEDLQVINNLWLDNNQLESWDGKILEGINLKELRLDGNKLRCLEDFDKIFIAHTTWLDGNPWNCDCLKNIQSWTEHHLEKTVMVFYSQMQCDADRLKEKMDALRNRLNELKRNRTKTKEDSEENMTESKLESLE